MATGTTRAVDCAKNAVASHACRRAQDRGCWLSAGLNTDVSAIRNGTCWADFVAPYGAAEVGFERLPFSHPLFIMFSSGTTGVPKCIVHCHGGALLQHLKEQQLLRREAG